MRRARGAIAWPTAAAGALALGALAIGAVAIGTLVIGRLAVGKLRLRHVVIDDLTVRRLRVLDREPQDIQSMASGQDRTKHDSREA
jgi:ornithine cyclodeaminase/alanine dehydrogenase-like protein (mu-crystallin family)